jgi:hypothetical protein
MAPATVAIVVAMAVLAGWVVGRVPLVTPAVRGGKAR